jgi:hypothetical protein
MIVINRAKAEEATRERLRAEREPRLTELDVQFMRAIEVGQDTAAIAAEKQALRDVTAKDLSGLTIEQLASLTLDKALPL